MSIDTALRPAFHVRARSAIAATLLAVGSFFPVGSVVFLSYSRIVSGRGDRRTFLLYVGLLAFLLALLNAGKLVEADEETYLMFLRDIGLNAPGGLLRALNDVTGRNEWGFYSISYFLFWLSGGSLKVIIVFWTFLTYFITGLSFARIFRERMTLSYALPIFASTAVLFINFALTAQVTRQYVAGTLILTSFAFFDKRARSLGLIVLAGFIHNSAFVFLLPWCVTLLIAKRMRGVPPWWLLLAGIGSLGAVGSVAYAIIESLSDGLVGMLANSMKDNGDMTLFKVASIVVATSILYAEMKRRFDPRLLPLFFALFFLVALLALVWKLPMFLLRFSFYVEFFATVTVALWLFRFAAHAKSATLLFLPVVANAFLLVRTIFSPWTYSWLEGLADNFVGALLVRMLAS
jgi:hypothetical protein